MQVPSMPAYQPAYQPMESAAMPVAPLPPQAFKRPLTISAPEDGLGAQPGAYAQMGYAPQGYGGGEGSGEGLPQRIPGPGPTASGGGRRYSAVPRQGM